MHGMIKFTYIKAIYAPNSWMMGSWKNIAKGRTMAFAKRFFHLKSKESVEKHKARCSRTTHCLSSPWYLVRTRTLSWRGIPSSALIFAALRSRRTGSNARTMLRTCRKYNVDISLLSRRYRIPRIWMTPSTIEVLQNYPNKVNSLI